MSANLSPFLVFFSRLKTNLSTHTRMIDKKAAPERHLSQWIRVTPHSQVDTSKTTHKWDSHSISNAIIPFWINDYSWLLHLRTPFLISSANFILYRGNKVSGKKLYKSTKVLYVLQFPSKYVIFQLRVCESQNGKMNFYKNSYD